MELGGNAPFVVFSDADVDVTVGGAMAAKIHNGAEACTAANRFFVHREIAVEFATKFAKRISTSRTSRGTDDGVAVGPLINQAAIDKVQRLVDDARKRGARVVTGGSSVDGDRLGQPGRSGHQDLQGFADIAEHRRRADAESDCQVRVGFVFAQVGEHEKRLLACFQSPPAGSAYTVLVP